VFNVNGTGDLSDENTHHCAILPTYTADFGGPLDFSTYTWRSHQWPCINDPEAWEIHGSNDQSVWTTISTDQFTCQMSGYQHVLNTFMLTYRYRYWKIEITTDGTGGWSCFSAFRYIDSSGQEGEPIAVSWTGTPFGGSQNQDFVDLVFNVNGGGDLLQVYTMHCGILSSYTADFGGPVYIDSYKWRGFSFQACLSDPAAWDILVSNDQSAWTIVSTGQFPCQADQAAGVLHTFMVEAPTPQPTETPTASPTESPSQMPSTVPTVMPSNTPSEQPTFIPSQSPTTNPTPTPTLTPSSLPTESLTLSPTNMPTIQLTWCTPTASSVCYRYWKIEITNDGTWGHTCFNVFRFITASGQEGEPIAVSWTGGVWPYGEYTQEKLDVVFNVNEGGDLIDKSTHHCATSPIYTADFGGPLYFNSYKWRSHQWPCINDPQAWKIFGSNDQSSWTTLSTETIPCESSGYQQVLHTFMLEVTNPPTPATQTFSPTESPTVSPTNMPSASIYRYWKIQITTDGDGDHTCFNAFRYIDASGHEAEPIAVSWTGGRWPYGDYSQAKLDVVFNVNGGGDLSDESTHHCAVLPSYTADFGGPMNFNKYKWRSHHWGCYNDAYDWIILGSNDKSAWTTLSTGHFPCEISGYQHVLRTFMIDPALPALTTAPTESPTESTTVSPTDMPILLSGSFRYWKIEITTDGWGKHTCFNAFRYMDANGQEGVPDAVFWTGGIWGKAYTQAGLEVVFNVNGGGDLSDESTHHCAVLPSYTADFGVPMVFSSYKWRSHHYECYNDAAAWNILGSNDKTAWTTLSTEQLPCIESEYQHELRTFML